MPTKADIKRLAKQPKLKVRKGDKVKIIAGKDKGQIGIVAKVDPKAQKLIVLQENPEDPDQWLALNAAIKHRKARFQGDKSERVVIPAPLHVSKVMVIDPASGEPSRIGRKRNDEGKLVRYAKKSGQVIHDEALYEED